MRKQNEYYWVHDVDDIDGMTIESYLIFDYRDRYVYGADTEEEAQKAVNSFNNTLRSLRAAAFERKPND